MLLFFRHGAKGGCFPAEGGRLKSLLMDLRTAELLLKIEANQEKIMSALADLQKAVSDLNTSVSSEIAAVTAALQAAAATNNGSVAASDVEAAVTQLQTIKANLDSETSTLVPAPPAPPANPGS